MILLYEGLYVTDESSNIVYINPIACEILGYKKNEMIGKNGHYLFHYHDKMTILKQKIVSFKRDKNIGRFHSENEYFKLKMKN